MRNRASVNQRDANQGTSRLFHALADGFRNFTRLAETDTDDTRPVTHDNQGAEAEATATLDHLCNSVDVNHPVVEFEVVRIDI